MTETINRARLWAAVAVAAAVLAVPSRMASLALLQAVWDALR